MRKPILLPIALVLVASIAFAASKPPATPVADVVAAERAFAARAQVVDARDAFVENFATDAVTFEPAPGPAFPGLKEGPAWGVNIRWRPADAGAARAGDLGWTTGPVEYRRDKAAVAPSSYGYYTSVWAKQSDGRWKVIADIGTHTPPPTFAIADWQGERADGRGAGTERRAWRGTPSARQLERTRNGLLDADRRLAAHAARSAQHGWDAALVADTRLHRDGMPPAIGRNAARDALRDGAATYDWTASGGRVAASGDLGFTYGSGAKHTTSGAQVFHYLAIWERHDGDWRLRVLVQNPEPPKPPAK